MLNVKVGNGEIQNLVEAGVIKVTSGDKIQVSVDEGSSYQVLLSDNQSDVILQVTNLDGSTYGVVLEGLASLYEAGDVITQLLLDINGETVTVAGMADLLGALDATAAGAALSQGRSFAEDNPNIDPNRSAAEDGDQLRSDGGINALGVDIEANEQPVVSDVFLIQNEIQGVEAAGDLNIITGQLTATDPNFGDTHTFSMVAGTLSVTDTNGVITLLDDSVTAVVNPDGTYTISGDFNDLSDGEIATVTFDYIATDAGGLSSEPATVSFAVTGTNDIPVVEAINVNGPDLWSLVAEGATLSTVESLAEMGISNDGSIPQDGSAIKFTIQTEANEQVSFNWDFLDNDWGTGSYNDFSFVVIDGNLFTLEDSLDTDISGNTVLSHLFDTSGVHTLTFGVMNSGDTAFDSALNINYISGGKLINVETVGTASSSSMVFYETSDSIDILGVDDTQDESSNFFTGALSVADDDVMNDGLHTFHVLQDDQNNNIVEVSGTTVITADDISVGTVQNLDGTWNYTIDGDFSALAAGETATVSFQYYADDTRGFDGTDGINESSISEPKTITVTITGTNDQPIVDTVVLGVDEVIYENRDQNEEDTNNDGILRNDEGTMTVSGDLTVSDEDVNDTHTFDQVANSVQSDNQLINPQDLNVVVNSDGSYSMTGDFTSLAAGETATVSFLYTATDSAVGSGENSTSEPKMVSITITGTNDQPVVESKVFDINDAEFGNTYYETHDNRDISGVDDTNGEHGSDRHSEPLNTLMGTLSVSDQDITDQHHFYVVDTQGNYTENVWTLDGDLDLKDYVSISSNDVNPSQIDIASITLANTSNWPFSNNYFDSADQIGFEVKGDFSSLAAGEHATVTFSYVAVDDSGVGTNGESNVSEPKTVTLTVTGTNDQPVVDNVVMGVDDTIYETNGENNTQDDVTTEVFGTLVATDNDLNDTHVFNVRDYTARDYYGQGQGGPGQHGDQGDIRFDNVEFFRKGSNNGAQTIKMMVDCTDVQVGHIDVTKLTLMNNNAGDSEVDFKLEGNFNALAAGETATVTFEYIANDKEGFGQNGDSNNEASLSEAKLVTITITGTNDQPVVSDVTVVADETINVDMDGNSFNGTTTVLTGSFIAADDDVNNSHEYIVTGLPENTGSEIVIEGVSYSVVSVLVGSTNTETIQNNALVALRVVGSDEVTLNDIKNLSIQVDGDNFTLSGDFEGLPAGVTLDIKFQYVVNDLEGFNGTDGLNETSLSETAWATVTITGTNDVPTMTVDSGSVVEDLLLTVSGQVEIVDADAGESEVQADSITGTYGDFVINTNGNWTYVLATTGARAEAVQALGEGQTVHESFNVTSEDGSLTKQVVINVIGQNDAPELTYEATDGINGIGINETQAGELLGILSVDDVDDTPAINGFSITGNDASLVEVVDNNGVFELRVKEGANIDFEQPNHQLDILIQYYDGNDYSAAHMVNVTINDITGVVTTIPATTLFSQTFDGHFNSEGWNLSHLGISETGGVLGNINHDNVVVSNTFDLSLHAGERVSIDFDLNYGANASLFSNRNWEGNDTFEVTVSDGDTTSTYTYSPDGRGDLPISFETEVPSDGQLSIELTSSNTTGREYWSIDDFNITTQEQEVLTFDSNSQGEIDIATLLDQSNDFKDENGNDVSNPDSLDEIDISDGSHILSNLSVEDFIAMSDDDNTLKITGDTGDTVQLNSDEWSLAEDHSGTGNIGHVDSDGDGFVAYTNSSDVGGAGAESLQLLIDDDINVDMV